MRSKTRKSQLIIKIYEKEKKKIKKKTIRRMNPNGRGIEKETQNTHTQKFQRP